MGLKYTRKAYLTRRAILEGEAPKPKSMPKIKFNKAGKPVSAKKSAAGKKAFKKNGLKPATKKRMAELRAMRKVKTQKGGAAAAGRRMRFW